MGNILNLCHRKKRCTSSEVINYANKVYSTNKFLIWIDLECWRIMSSAILLFELERCRTDRLSARSVHYGCFTEPPGE